MAFFQEGKMVVSNFLQRFLEHHPHILPFLERYLEHHPYASGAIAATIIIPLWEMIERLSSYY